MIVQLPNETIDDAAKVYTESWRESHKNICDTDFLEKHSLKFQKNYLLNSIKNGWYIFIYYTEKHPTGIVGLNYDTGEVGFLYVRPSEFRKGYGTKLLDFAVKKMLCYKTPFLVVLSTNKRAICLYEKYGFKNTSEKRILSQEKGIYELKYIYCA